MSQVSALTQSLVRARQSTQIRRKPLSTTVKPRAARLSTLASTMVVKPLSSQYLSGKHKRVKQVQHLRKARWS